MTRAHRFLSLVVVAGCATAGPAAERPSPLPHPPPLATVEARLDSLTVRQKAAQLIVPWLLGNYTAFDDSVFRVAHRWVSELEVGGIIISIGSPHDVAAKLNALQRASRLPLLVSADLEYGAGMRLLGGTSFPPVMAVGATGEALDAYAIGRAAALEGRAVGIHLNFAPDADVNNNPANPIINTRAFGEDPVAVGRLVAAYVRGLREHGMLATLKHFPGHGDTESDSHIGLAVIRADWARLDSLELVPFRAGIAAGADVVMSAHIAFPAFTGDDPATLSPAVLTGMLRDSLRFDGLVVTDALTMGAIVAKYGAGEATVRAFVAGSDLLLMPANPDSALDAMVAAVETGRVSGERLDRSVRRMLQLKERLGLFRGRTVPLDSVMHVVGAREFQRQAEDIAIRSLTLVRDTAGALRALREAGPSRLALIAYGDETNTTVGTTLAEALRQGGDTVDFFRLWPMSGPLSYDSARSIIGRAARVVFAANVRPVAWKGFIALPDTLARLITATDSLVPTVLVSLGSPYLLNQTPTIGSYLVAWSGARVVERAVAQALLGRVPIEGRLPTRIPPGYPIGHGLVLTTTGAREAPSASRP